MDAGATKHQRRAARRTAVHDMTLRQFGRRLAQSSGTGGYSFRKEKDVCFHFMRRWEDGGEDAQTLALNSARFVPHPSC